MNVEYQDGHKEQCGALTAEEAARLAAEKIVDPEVQRVTVYRENTNRHQRRKDAAEARKHGYGPNYRGEWK